MHPRYAAFWLVLSGSAACSKVATPAPPVVAPRPPPSAQEQACALGFKLSPDTLARCAAQHKGACYPSIEEACACAGCRTCMVLESHPVLVACGG